ncbi:hypothetical protein [Streptomyces sp. NPDC059215]|uniref:ISAzo13-like element transposase-related protein n=1 Tax=Streptomyces sp. NPDC059215 TaxID=3346772 RepID=UPI0036ABAC6F
MWWSATVRPACGETGTGGHGPPPLLAHTTRNWRERALAGHRVIAESAGATITKTDLTVHAELGAEPCCTGIQVREEVVAVLPVTRHRVHGGWNHPPSSASHRCDTDRRNVRLPSADTVTSHRMRLNLLLSRAPTCTCASRHSHKRAAVSGRGGHRSMPSGTLG